MRSLIAVIVAAGIITTISGCQNAQTRSAEGALVGGVLGAAAGGIIGHQSHHGGEGAAIGLAAGAVTGAIVGSQIPKERQGQAASPMQGATTSADASVNPNQIPLEKIVELARQGVDENVIIDKIRLTNSKYKLGEKDVDYLKKEGVSPKVINVMQGL